MIKGKRWCDPTESDDGFRVLVARYRPRGVPREQETWAAWLPQLGPSKVLHAAYYGKSGTPLTWEEYARRYLLEMEEQTFWTQTLARQHAEGCVTLLCSSACTEESRCHRSLLRGLIERSVPPPSDAEAARGVVRRKRT